MVLRKKSIVFNAIQGLIRSPFAAFALLSFAAILISIHYQHWYISLFPLVVGIYFRRRLIFEALLLEHSIEYSLGTFSWYSLVDKNGIYLGAIPIFPSHEITLAKKLNIRAVLSIVEPFEMSSSTLIGIPVTSAAWEAAEIHHLQLNSPDFSPPSFQVLEKGADYINQHIVQRRNVYVHCKSGKGRSASVVCAYFIKYKNMDSFSSWCEVCKMRPAIFPHESVEFKNILAFETWIRGCTRNTHESRKL